MVDPGLSRVESSTQILLKRWKLACLLFAIFFVGSVLIIWSFKPLYKAKVAILLPIVSVEDPGDRKQAPQSQTDAFVVRSYKSVVEDPGICESVIDALHLDRFAEFQPKASVISSAITWVQSTLGVKPDEASLVSKADLRKHLILERYQDRLVSKNDAKSLILDLSFEAENPYLAAKIANAHAQAFIASEVHFRREEAQEKSSWMKAELDNAAEEARNAQVTIQLRSASLFNSKELAATQAAELKALQMVADSKRVIFEEFLSKYRAMIAEERYSGSDIRILSLATVPVRPAFPQKLLLTSAAAVLSLMLAVGMSVVYTLLMRRETAEQFAERNGIAIAGRVNISGRRRRPWSRGDRLSRACFWEQIRSIRSALKLSSGRGAVIVVTSALPAEGKSLYAEALARSMACSGIRTLLIDANVGRPSFYAPEKRANDLCTYLEGRSNLLQSLVLPNASLPLYILGASKEKRYGNGDLLVGPRMRTLLEEVRLEFDAIIVDTPALNVLAEGLYVAHLADEVLLAALDRHSPLDAVRRAIGELRQRGKTIDGMIIGRIGHPSRTSYAHLKTYKDRVCPPELWTAAPWTPFWKSANAASQAAPRTAQMVEECLPMTDTVQSAS